MRSCFALVLGVLCAVPAVACGGGGGGDDDVTPDAGDPPVPVNGFRVVSPDIELAPGEESTYCFYFRTPNDKPLAIHEWSSSMTPGSHHMILFLTANDAQPPGTVTTDNCGFGSADGGTVWTYAAQRPEATITLPDDDGAGLPLAQQVPANSPAFVQMHYLNATETTLNAHVTIEASGLDDGVAFTHTAAFVTYNATISIPGNTLGHVESRSCSVPDDVKFWLMSTHSHKQSVHTDVKDGDATVFQSNDWESPGEQTFMTPDAFYTFATNRITYECTYDNASTRTITSGDSAVRDEMCMATGYYFPATRPLFCIDNAGPF
jgi:hypothetical protein